MARQDSGPRLLQPRIALLLLGPIFVALPGCTSTRAPAPAAVELTVLSWNLLHGASPDGELNLEAKASYIDALDVDLVFVQEIDERCRRSGDVDQMAVLGQRTGTDAAFGSFMPYQGGQYGLGTLSALPVLATEALRLPEGDEPRVALLRRVRVLGRSLLAINVHFNWTRDDTARFSQARALLAELATNSLPVIVAGDFNDDPGSRTLRAFYAAGFRHVEPPAPSWDAIEPSKDIDHVLVRSGAGLDLEPLGGEVLSESALSDHRPVRARIRAIATRAASSGR